MKRWTQTLGAVATLLVIACGGKSPKINKMEQECDTGNVRSCFALSLAQFDGVLTQKDKSASKRTLQAAIKLAQQQCHSGEAEACHLLGARLHVGTRNGMAKDRDRARDYFDRGCRAGSNRSCVMVHQLDIIAKAQAKRQRKKRRN